MNLNQLIHMLMAAQAQGATEVMVLRMDKEGNGVQSGVDWVAQKPVGDTAYMMLMQHADPAPNEALEAIDLA